MRYRSTTQTSSIRRKPQWIGDGGHDDAALAHLLLDSGMVGETPIHRLVGDGQRFIHIVDAPAPMLGLPDGVHAIYDFGGLGEVSPGRANRLARNRGIPLTPFLHVHVHRVGRFQECGRGQGVFVGRQSPRPGPDRRLPHADAVGFLADGVHQPGVGWLVVLPGLAVVADQFIRRDRHPVGHLAIQCCQQSFS